MTDHVKRIEEMLVKKGLLVGHVDWRKKRHAIAQTLAIELGQECNDAWIGKFAAAAKARGIRNISWWIADLVESGDAFTMAIDDEVAGKREPGQADRERSQVVRDQQAAEWQRYLDEQGISDELPCGCIRRNGTYEHVECWIHKGIVAKQVQA